MNYEGLPCPVCGRQRHENDDIVVCPDCGTPQHRECWMENGSCANAGKHMQGYVWSAAGKPEPMQNEPARQTQGVKVCLTCGSENPADASLCGKCGASLGESEVLLNVDDDGNRHCPYCGMIVDSEDKLCKHCGAPLMFVPRSAFNPYVEDSGLQENEIIGGNTAGELSRYVRKNVKRYVPLFRQFESGRKLSFNFGAFFFGPLWYFFRKIYKFGIVFIIVIAAVSPVFATLGNKMADIMEPYSEAINSRTISEEEMLKLSQELVNSTKRDFALGFGLLIGCNLIFAFLADRLYYKKITDDLQFLKSEVTDPNIQKAMLTQRGGTSLLSGICGFFTFRIASYIMIVIANYVAQKF